MNRKWMLLAGLLLTVIGGLAVAYTSYRQNVLSKISPFDDVRIECDLWQFKLEDQWYDLLTLEGLPTSEWLSFARSQYGDLWRERLGVDLDQVLDDYGKTLYFPWMSFVGRSQADGKEVAFRRFEANQVKRQGVFEANNGFRLPLDNKIERPRASYPYPEFAYLGKVWGDWPADNILGREQVIQDLQQLEWLIQEMFAYSQWRKIALSRAIDTMIFYLGESIPKDLFAWQVHQLLMTFGDSHAGVKKLNHGTGFLPFHLVDSQAGLLALKPDRSGFVDDQYPVVAAIDGETVDQWLGDARLLVADGSKTIIRRRSIKMLRAIALLRSLRGKESNTDVRLTLKKIDSEEHREQLLPLTQEKLSQPKFPAEGYQPNVPNTIGYLRLPSMSDESLVLSQWRTDLDQLKDKLGLIIDLRGNSGGTRDLLNLIGSYYATDDPASRLVNVAKGIRHPVQRQCVSSDGALFDRHLYPPTASRWNDAERQFINGFLEQWQPKWTPTPATSFTPWHVMLVPKGSGKLANMPTVILMDADNFSAADVFLGFFKGRPNVTLVGQASSGGSARAKTYQLTESGVEIRLGSMASFRRNGELYDGRGVKPDVKVERSAEFILGKADEALGMAVVELTKPR